MYALTCTNTIQRTQSRDKYCSLYGNNHMYCKNIYSRFLSFSYREFSVVSMSTGIIAMIAFSI